MNLGHGNTSSGTDTGPWTGDGLSGGWSDTIRLRCQGKLKHPGSRAAFRRVRRYTGLFVSIPKPSKLSTSCLTRFSAHAMCWIMTSWSIHWLDCGYVCRRCLMSLLASRRINNLSTTESICSLWSFIGDKSGMLSPQTPRIVIPGVFLLSNKSTDNFYFNWSFTRLINAQICYSVFWPYLPDLIDLFLCKRSNWVLIAASLRSSPPMPGLFLAKMKG